MSKLDCLALVEQAQSELFGPKRAAWLERLEQAYDPLRAALGQLLDSGEAERGLWLAAGLREFWLSTGRIDEGRDWLGAFLALPEAKARTALRAWALALIHLGTNKRVFEHDYTAVRTLYEASLAIYQELDSKIGIAYVRTNLGHLALEQDEFSVAYPLLKEALAILWDAKDLWAINFVLDGLAGVAAGQGQLERGLHLAGASEALRESVGILLPPVSQAWVERLLEPARNTLGEEGCAAAWAEGREMMLERAVAFALDERSLGDTGA
jgi:hypothetical protein